MHDPTPRANPPRGIVFECEDQKIQTAEEERCKYPALSRIFR
jgi:hypothetical protein